MRSVSARPTRTWDLHRGGVVGFQCFIGTPPNRVSLSPQNVFEVLQPEKFVGLVAKESPSFKLGKKWKEYQGIKNWEGLLDPLNDNLRNEIIRYGRFVEATYNSFDINPSSASYANCLYPENSLLARCDLPETGYRVTKYLNVTSGIELPQWMEKAPSWMQTQTSWIGYVAVCQDEKEIARLGRRDVVIVYRGTCTCLEWLENLRATLTDLSDGGPDPSPDACSRPMVQKGFLSLYASRTTTSPSLLEMIREEISRIIELYGDEPLSLTITGHSLGASLAILTAYDIKTMFKRTPLVSVISFGGPRVGNQSFRQCLDKLGIRILRIVNSDDVVPKVPGIVLKDGEDDYVAYNKDINVERVLYWIQQRMHDAQLVYAEVGQELRLRSKDSPYIKNGNVVTYHDIKTYLHLIDGFVSSTTPFKPATCQTMIVSK